jgi:hypothetical protein
MKEQEPPTLTEFQGWEIYPMPMFATLAVRDVAATTSEYQREDLQEQVAEQPESKVRVQVDAVGAVAAQRRSQAAWIVEHSHGQLQSLGPAS